MLITLSIYFIVGSTTMTKKNNKAAAIKGQREKSHIDYEPRTTIVLSFGSRTQYCSAGF